MSGQGLATSGVRSATAYVVALCLAVLLTYYPSLWGDFIWDDHAYLLSQPQARSLSLSSVLWAFSLDAAVSGHYHPLTWLSWMLDFAIAGGPDPRVFHATNLLLHAIHCGLLFFLFRDLFRGMGRSVPDLAIFLSLLAYAVHPLRVESVAWVTERRDLLSGVLYAATLLAYLQAGKQGDHRRWMALSGLLLVACGLSKAWAVSLLPVMWIIDSMLLHKLPPLRNNIRSHLAWLADRWMMALCTVLFVLAGLFAARRSGAMVGIDELSLLDRIQNAAFAWWYYPLKTLWPYPVAPYYGWAGFETGGAYLVAAAAGLSLIWLVALWRLSRDARPLALLLSYTLIVLPVLGLVQSGPQLVADRYTYIAILPFHVVLAVLIGNVTVTRARPIKAVSGLMAIAIIILLGLSAHRLNDVFRDEMSFWSRAVEVSPADVTARHNRAKLAWRAGNQQLAINDLEAAVAGEPTSVDAWSTLLDLHLAVGDVVAAERVADAARQRRLAPWGQWFLASRLATARGDQQSAHEALRMAAQTAESDPGLWLAVSRSAGALGDREAAMTAIDVAVRLDPEDPDVRLERVVHLAALGRAREALGEVDAALALAPPRWPSEAQALRWKAEIAGALTEAEHVD